MSSVVNNKEVSYAVAEDFKRRTQLLLDCNADYRDIISRQYYTLLFITEAVVLCRCSVSEVDEFGVAKGLGAHDRYIEMLENIYAQDYKELVGMKDSLKKYKVYRLEADYAKGITSPAVLKKRTCKGENLKLKLALSEMTLSCKKLFKVYKDEQKRKVNSGKDDKVDFFKLG